MHATSVNLPTITLNDLPDLLDTFYELKIPLLLMGTPGIGKSEVIQQFADRKKQQDPNFGFVDKRIAGADPGDIQGRQFYDSVNQKLMHIAPQEWPTDKDSSGVFVLEELADGTRLSTSAVYSILQERKVGQQKLPDGWWVVGCCNRPDDGSNARQITTALADRLAIFNVVADFGSFSEWATQNDISPKVLSFLRSNPQMLDMNEAQVEQGDLVAPSPRSWAQASKILDSEFYKSADSSLRVPMLSSKLGNATAISLLGYIESDCDSVDVVALMSCKTKTEILELLPNDINKLVYLVYAIHNLAVDSHSFKQAFLILTTILERANEKAESTGIVSNAGEVVAFAVEMLIIKHSNPNFVFEGKVNDISTLLKPFNILLTHGQG